VRTKKTNQAGTEQNLRRFERKMFAYGSLSLIARLVDDGTKGLAKKKNVFGRTRVRPQLVSAGPKVKESPVNKVKFFWGEQRKVP